MPPTAVAISSSTRISGDILPDLPDESLRKRLEEFSKPKGICIDEHSHRRLEDLSSQMASVYGLTECTLQLALTKQGEERTALIKTALDISSRATRAIKLFLCEWNVLLEEANRQRRDKTEGLLRRDDDADTSQAQ